MKYCFGIGRLLAALAAALAFACGDGATVVTPAVARQSISRGDISVAQIQLKAILQASPNTAEARYLLGVVFMMKGDPAAAQLELIKAGEGGFDEEQVEAKMARVILAMNRHKEVIQRFGRKSLSDPLANAELKAAVAVAHARQGQNADSQVAIEEALKADPKSPWVLLTRARLLAGDSKFDEALATVSDAINAGEPSGEAYLLRGTLLRLVKKDVPGALQAYDAAAKDELSLVAARSLAIQTHLGARQLKEAKAQLAELQKTHAKSVQTIFLDAVLAFEGGDFARTDVLVESLLRHVPDSPQLLTLGGATSLRLGNLIAAETKLGRVVQTIENAPQARKLLVETYLRMGQPEKGLSTLRKLMEKGTTDSDVLVLAAHAALQLGRPAEAEGYFSEASKLKPHDAGIRTALALTDLARGNTGAAFDALQQVAASDPGDTADLALISAHLRRREFESAIRAADALAKKIPGKSLALNLRGQALRGKGDLAGARIAFESSLKLDAGQHVATMSLADLDLQQGQVVAAKRRLEEAFKTSPGNVPVALALMNIMSRQKASSEQILAVVDASIRAAPTDPNARIAKITQLTRTGDTKAAAGAAQAAIASFPQTPQILEVAGQALFMAGDDQQAISAFNKLIGLTPRSAAPYLRLVDLFNRRGDVAASSFNLNRAFEIEPLSAAVHRALLIQAARTKDYRSVLSAAKGLQRRYGDSAVGHMLEGDAESARKAWPAAQAAYKAGMSKQDAAAKPHLAYYTVLVAAGDSVGADRFAQDWLRAHPSDVAFRDRLGSLAIVKKDYTRAERLFREALAVQPKNAAVLNNLAWLLADRGDRSAVNLAEQALALAPESAPVMDTMAKSLVLVGQLDRAIELQRQAMDALPDRIQYRLNLVRLLIKAERADDARRMLDDFPPEADVRALKVDLESLRQRVGR